MMLQERLIVRVLQAAAIVVMLVVTTSPVRSQHVVLLDVDTTAFPVLHGRFVAVDGQGRQQYPTTTQISIYEHGARQIVERVTCNDTAATMALSAVLVMDASTSMRGVNLDVAKAGARAWISAMAWLNGECALVSAGDGSHIVQDLTSDTTSLSNALDALSAEGVMDHNAALLHPVGGALSAVSRGTNRRVVVLLTDGPTEALLTDDILAEAQRLNCTINVVALGMPASPALREIAEQTGGLVIDSVLNAAQAVKAYRTILAVMQGAVPCTVTWRSGPSCGTADSAIELLWLGDTARATVAMHPDRKARLEFSPNQVAFVKPRLGDVLSRKIVVTARNAPFTVNAVVPTDASFQITPSRFALADGDSIELTVFYTVQDSTLRNCVFQFINDVCSQEYYVSAGYGGRVPGTTTLRVTHPTGGERFSEGETIEIRWEGIPVDNTVQLDYSTNSGVSWTTIEQRAAGGRYFWRDIPRLRDSAVSIRIAHGTYPDGFDPQKSSPQIVWEGSFVDKLEPSRGISPYDIVQLPDGDFAICGKRDHDYGMMFVVLKYTHDGDSLMWLRSHICETEGANVAKSLVYQPNGTIVAVGRADCMRTVQDGHITKRESLGSNYAVARIDAQSGKSEGMSTWGDVTNEELNAVCLVADGSSGYAGMKYISEERQMDVDVSWQNINRQIGGSGWDHPVSMMQATSGAIVVVGGTRSNDGDVTGYHGNLDALIVALDGTNGNILWLRSLGGSGTEEARSVVQLSDGDYLVAGWTTSSDGDVTGVKGDTDVWLIKLDATTGDIIWQRTMGGSGKDYAQSAIEAADGSIVLVGRTESSDGDVTGYNGGGDCWMVKVSAQDGSIIWEQAFATSQGEIAHSLIQTNEGVYVGVGERNNKAWIFGVSDVAVAQADICDSAFFITRPKMLGRNVDMNLCVVGSVRDSLVVAAVRNTGLHPTTVKEIRFVGVDSAAFSVVSHAPPFMVQPGTVAAVELRFRPMRVGDHSATMQILCGSDTLMQTVRGVGVEDVFAAANRFIDFGTVDRKAYRDTLTTVSLAGLSSISYQVTGVRIAGQHRGSFAIKRGGGSFAMQRDVPHELELRCAPQTFGRIGATLEFLGKDGVKIGAIQLYAEGTGVFDTVKTTIAMRDITASVGQQVALSMVLSEHENLDHDMAPRAFNATIAVNPTVLHIADASYEHTIISPSVSHLSVTGVRGSEATLLSIPALVTLGTTEYAPVQIVDFQWQTTSIPVQVTTVDGAVRVADICEEGGTRLFVPSDGRFSLTCRPNPAETIVELRYGVAEVAPVTIDVIDRTGRTVLTPVVNPRVQPGLYATLVDVSLLSAGPYIVVLRSPNAVLSTRLDIAR